MFHKRNKDTKNEQVDQANRMRDFMIREFGEDAPFLIATPEGITMQGKNYELYGLIELIKRDAAAKLAVLDGADQGQEAINLNGGGKMPPELKAILEKAIGGKGKVVELNLSEILGAMPDCGDPDCKGHEESRGKK